MLRDYNINTNKLKLKEVYVVMGSPPNFASNIKRIN